jgi:hypothetical protein
MKKEIDEPLLGDSGYDMSIDELEFIMDKNNVDDK